MNYNGGNGVKCVFFENYDCILMGIKRTANPAVSWRLEAVSLSDIQLPSDLEPIHISRCVSLFGTESETKNSHFWGVAGVSTSLQYPAYAGR